MFGIKKLKERIEKLESENAILKSNVGMLLDVCKPQIDQKVKEKVNELKKILEKMFNDMFGYKEPEENKKSETPSVTKDNDFKWETVLEKKDENKQVEPKKYDKNGIKYKDVRYSSLMQYYTKYNLNLEIRGFKPMKRMGEKEAATLLYLFDKYKYVDEIAKHIHLSETTIKTYAYELRRNGYLIYDNEIGRVANGCLIYNK